MALKIRKNIKMKAIGSHVTGNGPPAGGKEPRATSKLERSKAKRRDSILDGAKDLLKRESDEELSMRTLAKRANVSLATPYNLFGSKQGVMLALVKREGARFLDRLNEDHSDDTIERVFRFIDGMFDMYRSDPPYFKALLSTLYTSDDADLRQELRRPRIAYLRRLMRESVAAGTLGTDISIGLVSRQLLGLNLFFIQEWVTGGMTLERACLETEFGFSVVLLALANDTGKKQLLARNARLEAMIEGS
jgi:AcrR family transcriptional regulator